MLKGKIEIEGKTYSDLELAIDEAKKWIADGYREGLNSNDSGSYSFKIEGEEEEVKAQ